MAAGALKMSLAEVTAFLEREFPQGFAPEQGRIIEAVGPGTACVRFQATQRDLRPGGTVSGPAMMALCDATMYVAILAAIGPVALAVTTNLSINFLRKPAAGALVAECKLLKLGKRLAVGEITVRSAGEEEPVAHCVATYSIPPIA